MPDKYRNRETLKTHDNTYGKYNTRSTRQRTPSGRRRAARALLLVVVLLVVLVVVLVVLLVLGACPTHVVQSGGVRGQRGIYLRQRGSAGGERGGVGCLVRGQGWG